MTTYKISDYEGTTIEIPDGAVFESDCPHCETVHWVTSNKGELSCSSCGNLVHKVWVKLRGIAEDSH